MSGQDKMWNDYIWTKHHPTHDVNMTYRYALAFWIVYFWKKHQLKSSK